MNKVFIIYALLLFSIPSFTQKDEIQWGGEYEDRGYYSIIGESDNALFVERKYNTRLNNRNVDIELLRFDSEMEVTHGIELRDLEQSNYESIVTINSPEGLAHIYYQTSKQGEQFVSAQLFDHQSLRKTEIVDLARFKISKHADQTVRQDGNYQFSYALDVILSRDKTKMAIFYDQEKVGKKKRNFYQYCIIDINNRFSILHKGDFYSDDQSNKYLMSDRHLSNSGKLTYAIKRYVKNNGTEHINKKPAYDYEIHHMSGDSLEYIYDIRVKKEYLDKVVLGSDEEDNLYIAGYLRKQPWGDIKKSYLLSLDNLGYDRYKVVDEYSRRDVKKIQGKEGNKLDDNFQTIDIFPTNDIVYLVRQYRRRGSRNNTFNNTGFGVNRMNQFNDLIYFWNYEDVIIEGIGKNTGERLWTAINPREHEDDNTFSRYFITGQMELINNNLVFLYNEREENIVRIRRKENLKRTDIPGDRTAITMAVINSNGELMYHVIDEEDHFHIPERGAFISNDDIYFLYHHKNYKRFKVGVSRSEN
ncbi:MAG: hypothetical protein P1U56_04695 [Saprospiraceae bacterium]|nr:hypothetical protein [Saprospiraceae bacterium]